MSRIPSLRPEPERDRYDRYVLPDPAGTGRRSWTRATTLASTLTDQYAIGKWRQRKVAEGLAVDRTMLDPVPALAAEIAAAGDDWKDAQQAKRELDAICAGAASLAGADDGADAGSDLHTLTEWYDVGRAYEVIGAATTEMTNDLVAYAEALRDASIVCPPEYVERIVINTEVDSAGTFDRLVRVPGVDRLVVADLKTQKSLAFGFLSMCLQLAEYAHAQFIVDPDTGELAPMPEVETEWGLVMHLPVGSQTCTLYRIDLVTGWHAALVAHEVRRLRSLSKQLGAPYEPHDGGRRTEHPTPELTAGSVPVEHPHPEVTPPGDRLMYLIRVAQHPAALIGLWESASARGEWTDAHTAAARARKAELALVTA